MIAALRTDGKNQANNFTLFLPYSRSCLSQLFSVKLLKKKKKHKDFVDKTHNSVKKNRETLS